MREKSAQSSSDGENTGRRRPKQRRSQAKVDAIMRGAIRVLAEEGYSGASTVKIARAAGVGVGTIYDYFPDKDAIFADYIDQQVGEIVERIVANFSGRQFVTVEETVRHVIENSVVYTMHNQASLNAMVGKIPGAYDGHMLRNVMQRLYVVAENFNRMHGLFSDAEKMKRATYVLANTLTGFFIRLVTDPDVPLNKQELTDELVTLVMSYLYSENPAR